MTPGAESRRPRVVVAGAGFAGLWAVQKLDGEDVDVVLLDRQNYHTFLPLLYQVAAAELGPTEIAYPVRSILRKAKNVTFRMGEITEVDPGERIVRTSTDELSYDHLVLAMGATTHFFGVEGAAKHAFPLRAMDEAVPLRHHVLSCFEAAAHEEDADRRRRLLTFAVVGGGPTGVEFSGALAELVHGPLQRDYPMLDMDQVRIVLLEAMDRVLGGMPEGLSDYARDRLERRKVEVRLDTPVEGVEATRIHLAGGETLDTETVVWTGGVKGVPGPEAWGLPMGPGMRVRVEPTMAVPGHEGVWVAGDLAYLEDEDGEPHPGVAPVAIQQGSLVAANILRVEGGESLREFRYRDPGMMAVIGRNAAVARVGGRTFTGFVAWVMWLVVHVAKLIGFRNRALVLVNWAWNYISFERAVRLILPYERKGRRPGLAPEEPGRVPEA
ncbi:MAG: NAD(P)/FAD-dependent oxidoreductase [Gemmatimonadales bacterium]|nr:MAG: NAD(P)/FAD-dependent oxidoreductase [Gemmatimonadales bacterium]